MCLWTSTSQASEMMKDPQELARDNEHLRHRLKALAAYARQMRRAQREYFSSNGNDALRRISLKAAKQMEAQCDQYLRLIELEKLG